MRLSLFSSLLGISSVYSYDPWANGPYESMHKTYYPILSWGLDHMIDVWAPNVEEGFSSPVIYFVGGLGGLMPGIAYGKLMDRIVSHGYTVVQPANWGNNPVDNYEGLWLDPIMEWASEHLAYELHKAGTKVNPDHTRIFLMSHSAGGHVAVEYLKHHCANVKGTILLSPVDGFDPFGLIHIDAITPGEYLNYAIPQLIMMTGLDNKPGIDGAGGLMPPCAPDELSNMRFYNAFPGNTWLINATQFGHGDFMDDFFIDSIQMTHFCGAADKSIDRVPYRSLVGGAITTFIKYVLGEEPCEVMEYLEDPTFMPVPATVLNKASVIAPSEDKCDQVECQWQEAPYS